MSRSDLRMVVVALGLVTFGFAGDRADAQQTWTGAGADNLWSTSGNWSTLPNATGATLVFSGTTNTSSVNDRVTSAASIGFPSTTSGGFVLSGSGITLTAATALTVGQNSAGTITDEIAMNVKMTNATTTLQTQSLGAGVHNVIMSGTISETTAPTILQKGGAGGYMTLSANNTFSGQMRIQTGGVIIPRFGNVGQASPMGLSLTPPRVGNGVADGEIIYTGGGETTDRQFQLGSNTASNGGGSKVTNNGSGAVVFSSGSFNLAGWTNVNTARYLTLSGSNTGDNRIDGVIQDNNGTAGAIAVKKVGSGKWILAGSNTYTGGTEVNAGTLLVNGTLSTPGNPVQVLAGATLGGTGVIGSAATVSGIVAPGSSGIGTLTFSSGVTWNGGATAASTTDWLFDLGGSNTSDLASIAGNFTKGSGAAFRFDLGNATTQGSYTLASWTGSTTFSAGDFSYTNLGGGNTGTFDVVGSSLVLTIVPEPTTTVGLIASGVAGLFAARRGRRRNG
jgi:fibronectin-binding autotransporter adhesin